MYKIEKKNNINKRKAYCNKQFELRYMVLCYGCCFFHVLFLFFYHFYTAHTCGM